MISNNLGKRSLEQRHHGGSGHPGQSPAVAVVWCLAVLFAPNGGVLHAVEAAGLYRYQDENGVWHFTDRPPVGSTADVVATDIRGEAPPALDVEATSDPVPAMRLRNRYAIAVQAVLTVGDERIEVVVGAGETVTVPVDRLPAGASEISYGYVLGDPAAEHRPPRPYRVPFAVGARYRVSQGFHGGITHTDAASIYAVDIAMPVGTGIVAARAGVVVETAYANFAGGVGPARKGREANLVRIVHDDGTHALYAHLDRASVRVRPGQRVARGELIAASGNTGFSTGPHLHFAILRNAGLQTRSVPFTFEGAAGEAVTPRQDLWLTAYP